MKSGAEGVYCGALPERGLGFALKIDDGAKRAAEAVAVQLIAQASIRRRASLGPVRAAHQLARGGGRAGCERRRRCERALDALR